MTTGCTLTSSVASSVIISDPEEVIPGGTWLLTPPPEIVRSPSVRPKLWTPDENSADTVNASAPTPDAAEEFVALTEEDYVKLITVLSLPHEPVPQLSDPAFLMMLQS